MRRGKVVGIITQSDVFRAFMHITGILQGGVQFALRLEDRPGLIKEVVDLLRARGARFVSLLSSYATSQEGYRDVYIRVKNLPPEALGAAKEELASRFELLYVIRKRAKGGESLNHRLQSFFRYGRLLIPLPAFKRGELQELLLSPPLKRGIWDLRPSSGTNLWQTL